MGKFIFFDNALNNTIRDFLIHRIPIEILPKYQPLLDRNRIEEIYEIDTDGVAKLEEIGIYANCIIKVGPSYSGFQLPKGYSFDYILKLIK